MRNLKNIILILCLFLSASMISCDYDKKPVWVIGKDIIKKLNAGEYEDIEKYIDHLVSKKPYTLDGTRVLEDLYPFVADRLYTRDMLDKWCAGESPHYSSFIIRGNYFVNLAWKHRGSDLGYTITAEGRIKMREYLELAKQDLERAYSLNPRDPNAAASMIRVCTGLNCGEEEMDTWFKRAVEADPVAYRAYAGKQNFLRPKWFGSKEKDLAFAEHCDKNSPPKSVIHEIMLDYIIEKGKWEIKDLNKYYRDPSLKKTIDDVARRTLVNFPDSTSIRKKLAYIETNIGNYEKAVELYNETLEKDPGNPDALRMRARLYAVNLGKPDLAETDIKKSFKSDPDSPDIIDDMARVARMSGDNEKAVEYYTKAIERKPKLKILYVGRGMAKMTGFQDYAGAMDDFKKALKLDSRLIHAHRLMGECLERLSRFEEAKEYYRKTLALVEAQESKSFGPGIKSQAAQNLKRMLNMKLDRLNGKPVTGPMGGMGTRGGMGGFGGPMDGMGARSSIPRDILSQYVGTYKLDPKTDIIIRLSSIRLLIQLTGQRGFFPLFDVSETKFFNRILNAEIEFVKDDNGNVTHLMLTQDGVQKKAVRTSDKISDRKEITLPADILSRYVGSYELSPVRNIDITIEGNRLFAQTTGLTKKAIAPESETKFFYRIVDAQLEFFKDESEKVSHLVLTQGNIMTKAPRKQEAVMSVPDNYGLTDKTAVKTGDGPRGERAYLDKLHGPKGETVKYKRLGSCCAFETPNSQWGGLLDKYEVTYEGLSKPVIVYLNMYDPPTGSFFAPPGFKLINEK